MPRHVTQSEFIEHHQKTIEKHQNRMMSEFQTLSHGEMQILIEAVAHRRKLIGFAKSGRLKIFIIN